MRFKDVLFGFGLSMVFLSAVFLVVYRFENRHIAQTYDQMVVERAHELGMVWPTDDVAEIVRQALELGMVFEHDGELVGIAEFEIIDEEGG